MDDTQPSALEATCRRCGSPVRIGTYGPNAHIETAFDLWMCSNNHMFGGDCAEGQGFLGQANWRKSHYYGFAHASQIQAAESVHDRLLVFNSDYFSRYGREPTDDDLEIPVTVGELKRLLASSADRSRYRRALLTIANGPWPEDMDSPERQCHFDNRMARMALGFAPLHWDEPTSITINSLRDRISRLLQALNQIMSDDERDGHQCDGPTYGHFGTIARDAFYDEK